MAMLTKCYPWREMNRSQEDWTTGLPCGPASRLAKAAHLSVLPQDSDAGVCATLSCLCVKQEEKGIMPTTNKEVAPLEELKGIGRTLQDAGLTLLQAASNAVSAVAKDTLTATNAVIAAAEDTLDAAQKKLRRLREEK